MSLFFVATRYRIAIVPFLAIFAAFALFSAGKAAGEKNYPKFAWLCLALISIFVFTNYDKVFAKKIHRGKGDAYAVFDYHLINAIKYENNSDYRNAIKELSLLNKIEPANSLILFRLGVVYFQLHDFKTAEKMFKEVIKISPYSVNAYYNLGFIYNKQQRFTEAKDTLKKAVFLDPEDAKAHFELGFAYKSLQDFKNAKKEFNLALKKINRWRIQDREIIKNELISLGK
jgi:tetratricopeptide (TPR) repeat protein